MNQEFENTFLSLIEEKQQKLLRICSVHAKDMEELKLLFQEVLIHIWESISSFSGSHKWSQELGVFLLLPYFSEISQNRDIKRSFYQTVF